MGCKPSFSRNVGNDEDLSPRGETRSACVAQRGWCASRESNLRKPLINGVAAILFICAGLIHWPKAGVMTFGAIVGYFLGSYWSQKIPQQRVRQLITFIGLLLSAVTFYQQFLR